MAYAKTQKGAIERVKKKRYIRKCGLSVKSNITNKKLNKIYNSLMGKC